MSSDHVIYQSAKTWQYGLWKAIFVDRLQHFIVVCLTGGYYVQQRSFTL
jgi:hypothetical protein